MARRLFIASSANPRLKAVRKLARNPSPALCLAEGRRAVAAAVESGACVCELFAAPALLGRLDRELVDRAEAGGARVVEVDTRAFESLVAQRRPDGLLATVRRPSLELGRLELAADALVAVAVGIERPGNLGTIIRTACAADVDAVIVADPRTDPYHPDVVRGSVGTIFRVAVATATTDAALAWLRERTFRVLATSPHGETLYRHIAYDGPVALVVGSERHGLASDWLGAADLRLAIPLPGGADSLNVAVAAGIVLFEARHRRSVPSSPVSSPP